MAEQTKQRRSSYCKIFVSLSYILGIFLAIFLSLVIIVGTVASHTSLLATNNAYVTIPPVAKVTPSFSGLSSDSTGMFSTRLQNYLSSLGSRVGVAIYIPATDQYYLHNASQKFPMASSMKIPIMLTKLSQVEKQNRPLTDGEAQQLEAMIESSDNDAAESLYQEVGTASGVMDFLNSHELSGIIPDPTTWGTSTASPQAMVDLLSALSAGELLSAPWTAYALSLMQNVVPDQRFGIGDTAPRRSIVSMKNGWLLLDQGWAVNSSGIVQTPRITYILSVYTMGGASQEGSMRIIRTICRQIATALV
jgi:beta-lactamase class A